MMSFIPIFPLSIVVYPGEVLNLHIFEPRYIQLIGECLAEKRAFGIPVVLGDTVQELGMSMEITGVEKRYDSGKMDIRTRGMRVFRILEPVKEIPDKLYSGAIVDFPDNNMETEDTRIALLIRREVKRLFDLLNLSEKFPPRQIITSYDLAHFVGFSRQQEYELLGLLDELQRLEYIRKHLSTLAPVIKELEHIRTRIRMNGHFRELS